MTKERNECYGCGRPWKEPSLFCPMCQEKGAQGAAPSIAGFVAKYTPTTGTELHNVKYSDPCGKCGKPNSVTPVGWFCAECSEKMDLSDRVKKAQGR